MAIKLIAVFLIMISYQANAYFQDVTLKVETDKILESPQMDRVKIFNPMFRVSDPDFFGQGLLYPKIIKIDSSANSDRFTAQFICNDLGYGEVMKGENKKFLDNKHLLAFRDSADIKKADLYYYKTNSTTTTFYRTLVCRLDKYPIPSNKCSNSKDPFPEPEIKP